MRSLAEKEDSTDAPGDQEIVLSDVRARFEDRVVFDGLTCSIPRGRISVVLGASGAGKSTLLRLIGGLVCPESGRILVAGEEVACMDEGELYKIRRQLGMMFQNGALLDSWTIFDNLALPLRERGDDEAGIQAAVRQSLASVGLKDVEELLPAQLSGGMVKRAALARAIIGHPRILLCDEPFSGLDPLSLRRIETLLVSLHRELGTTMIVVSHDVPSTLRMADHIVLLIDRACFEGSPRDLLASEDERVREFLSTDGRVPSEEARPTGGAR